MPRLILLAVVFALTLAASACDKRQTSAEKANTERIRIVSLSPAISRTLIDFGLQDRLVGRTPHCKSVDQSIPVAGDLLNIDYEAMIRLRPTHVLVQPPIAGIDQHLLDLAAQRGWKIGQWHLNGRDDIETMIRDLPEVLFADMTPERADAAKRSADILNDIANGFSPGGLKLFQDRTLILHSIDPVLVSGTGTYLHDILSTFGATNVTTARGWVQLTVEDIVRLNPRAIIFVRPGAGEQEAAAALEELERLQVEAVQSNRIAVASSEDGEMPSSGIIHVAQEFKAILHRFEKQSR